MNELEHAKKQAEKLKSREMKEGWMKDDKWRMMNEEWWWMNEEWVLVTDVLTDIGECRVAFATENFGLTYLVK